MKRTNILILLSLVSVICLLGFTSSEQDEHRRNNVLIDIVVQGLQRNHFSEVDIDDDFSSRVFEIYLHRLDYSKRFLFKSDVEDLSVFETKIDDEIKNRSFALLEKSIELMDKRVEETRVIYQEILEKPFDFTVEEDFEMDSEKRDYPASSEEMNELWRKILKYQTLARLENKLENQEKAIEKNDTSIEIKTFAQIEENCRKAILKRNNSWFHSYDQLEWPDRRSTYLNAITSSFDPHTSFMPPRDKENFDIGMTGQFEGIGATLTSRDGYVTVTRIVVGSASWKQGELQEEDKILKVAQGNEEPVDIVDMRLDKAVKLIRGPKDSEVRLTVQKIDASVVVIPIIRDVVILKETYAKSVIIDDDSKIGYIKLPKFYADFNKKGGRNCAEDMALEIEKLKEENVDGIIIDLRNNGGGSLQDVVKIAGLFIEDGPIVQVKARNLEPFIFEDKDEKVQYDGPLAIMVNPFSASASEILAAAMQDYHRAVIVGSSSTYGKGTVQKIIDFDRILPSNLSDLKPLGAMKVTMQKFYRINGGTTQLQGVIPDIILPNNYSYLDIGEKDLDYPLPFDNIDAAKYDTWKGSWEKSIKKIRKKSEKRVGGNKIFAGIEQNAHRLKDRKSETIVSLNLEKFKIEKKNLQEQSKKYKDLLREPTGIKIVSLKSDILEIEKDSVDEIKLKWHKNLGKDVYLFETVNILNDLM
ncbi:MAG: carboxy terminal-processing peptidase [Bacteroidota bacterium]|nr:carboxy terminal-processing peptidase [Bacteroidota bacterium]